MSDVLYVRVPSARDRVDHTSGSVQSLGEGVFRSEASLVALPCTVSHPGIAAPWFQVVFSNSSARTKVLMQYWVSVQWGTLRKFFVRR